VQTVSVEGFAATLPAGSRVEVRVAAGDFVTERTPLATLRPAPADRDAFERAARGCVSVTSERTLEQDAAFGMRQLADIALRAISPSLNDPTTAVACIRYLGACLERLATQALPPRERRVGEATVLVRRRSFAEYVEPLIELSRYASADARVVIALLEALAGAAEAAREEGAEARVATLREAAATVSEPALEAARTERDRDLVRAAQQQV
jgi:uncharacterized membrane protein